MLHQKPAGIIQELVVFKSFYIRPTEKILVFRVMLGCMLECNSLIGLLKSQNRYHVNLRLSNKVQFRLYHSLLIINKKTGSVC